ncbi:MAG: NAD-dependent malic enzyme, partial [Evtepia sp.]
IVIAAALMNALKVVGKKKESARIVICGAGSAGSAGGKLLLDMGFPNIIFCDRNGILCVGDPKLSPEHAALAALSNPDHRQGSLADAMRGADVFIGVSGPGLLSSDMVRSMAKDSIILAMSNPTPEIMPDLAQEAGAAIVGTGRSDFPNQINNVLVFPGLFKGALSVGALQITESMKHAAAYALAALIPEDELSPTCIIPSPLDPRAAIAVSEAVAMDAVRCGNVRA